MTLDLTRDEELGSTRLRYAMTLEIEERLDRDLMDTTTMSTSDTICLDFEHWSATHTRSVSEKDIRLIDTEFGIETARTGMSDTTHIEVRSTECESEESDHSIHLGSSYIYVHLCIYICPIIDTRTSKMRPRLENEVTIKRTTLT